MERERSSSSHKDTMEELNESIIELSDEDLYAVWGGQGLDNLTGGGDGLPTSGGIFSGVQTLSNTLGFVV